MSVNGSAKPLNPDAVDVIVGLGVASSWEIDAAGPSVTELVVTVRWDDGTILTVNDNVVRLMGKSRETLIGALFDGIMKKGLPPSTEAHPDDVEALRKLAEADDTRTIVGPIDDEWMPEGADAPVQLTVWCQWTNYELRVKEGWNSRVGAFIIRGRLKSPRDDNSVRQLLREEMAHRDWRVRDLADRLNVRFGVVARWLVDDDSKLVVPAPLMCFKIADTFNLDPVYVFRRAGYWPMDNLPRHPHQDEMDGLLRLLQRIMVNVPEGEWSLARAVAQSQLDSLQVLLNRISENL